MTCKEASDCAEIEEKWYDRWEKAGLFRANPESSAIPYAIMMPPPNVTGILHIGHALNHTLQDVLTRYRRMSGRDVLWQPGTDHAGIATQMVVERNLEQEGIARRDLGREKFVEKVWAWKAHSGGTIVRQLRKLGVSPDWSRERFTMDEGLCRAVREIFVRLYREGLIYRDKRLVNWDPKLLTAISDLEVEQRETKGKMWYFRYPVEGTEETVTIATTRPETMLGDTGVAVHPDDDRYKGLVGKMVRLPLMGRLIPIVADSHADPEKGSGAVKITPAHDFNDFEVGCRHGLLAVSVLDVQADVVSEPLTLLRLLQGGGTTVETGPDGRPLTEEIPEDLRGLSRFDARERIVERMDALGLLERVEENLMTTPCGDRSGVVIEPRLTDQWFVDAPKLARRPIEAVESGETAFVPKHWENTFFEWMRNIQPWCVSRQLWWGHQIPAWFGPDGRPFVAMTEEEAAAEARRHYGRDVTLERDPDVLDTWFSSALWPFSTLGWPEKTPELDRYYPTDVLVTGFDIIFFWVARMMMFGLYVMDDVPFRTVYVHALIRDEKGQKMSKAKGNVVDPLELTREYGADALRFTLAAMAAQGRDIRMSAQRVAGYRNFATKLRNAARFCDMNGCVQGEGFDPSATQSTLNRWIVAKLRQCAVQVGAGLESCKFNEAAQAVYQFVWNSFCDWFLEFAKPVFNGADEPAKTETRATAAWVLERILILLHPFMPFVTEELWQKTAKRDGFLIQQPWPFLEDGEETEAVDEMDWVVSFIAAVRSVRAEINAPPGAKIATILKGAGAETRRRLESHRFLIESLARLRDVVFSDDVPGSNVAQAVVGEATAVLLLEGVVDVNVERGRLDKELKKQEAESARIAAKLAKPDFLAKAAPEVVEEQKERLAETEARCIRLRDALRRLG